MNYLKVCSAVIVLTVAYPVGMDKSVSAHPLLEYSDEETNTLGCLCPPSGEEFKLTVLNDINSSRKSSDCVTFLI